MTVSLQTKKKLFFIFLLLTFTAFIVDAIDLDVQDYEIHIFTNPYKGIDTCNTITTLASDGLKWEPIFITYHIQQDESDSIPSSAHQLPNGFRAPPSWS